jgi:hypothetical protein
LTNQASSSANATGRNHGDRSHHSALLAAIITILRIVVVVIIFGAVVVGPALLVLFLKARRRSRRRTAPNTRDQIAGGWAELLDRASDAGARLPHWGTRREQAMILGATVSDLAELANAATFGPIDPEPTTVALFWRQVDESVDQMYAGLSFWRRLKAKLSLASLRPEFVTIRRLTGPLAQP